jgi:CheY-like chemotaxis protein
LTISERLVALMGGRIWLESEPGRGSTFHFTARFGIAADAAAGLRDTDELPFLRRLPPLTVLVAEDNVVNRTLIQRILERHGHRVVEARDGRQVLQALERAKFDLVLMDVEMPELGGIDATRRIRERERERGGHVPIIALTAHALAGDRERCLAAGMDGYVAKPIRRSTLFAAIAAVLPETGASQLASAPARRVADDREEPLQEMFVRSAHADLARMRAALHHDKLAEIHQLAHSMAGAAFAVGADDVGRLARELKDPARADLARAPATYEALTTALHKFARGYRKREPGERGRGPRGIVNPCDREER